LRSQNAIDCLRGPHRFPPVGPIRRILVLPIGRNNDASRRYRRSVPVTTISISRLPHLEHRNRSRQSGTVVSGSYRRACSAGSGSCGIRSDCRTTWGCCKWFRTDLRRCRAAGVTNPAPRRGNLLGYGCSVLVEIMTKARAIAPFRAASGWLRPSCANKASGVLASRQ